MRQLHPLRNVRALTHQCTHIPSLPSTTPATHPLKTPPITSRARIHTPQELKAERTRRQEAEAEMKALLANVVPP